MTDQFALFSAPEVTESVFRPVHYLGSKARILDAIEEAVQEVDGSGGRACDLFAGSGVVAARLANSRPVFAADIQEYSRVLASALLHPPGLSASRLGSVLEDARSRFESLIAGPLRALVAYEQRCVRLADSGNPEPLCELVEFGSILAATRGSGSRDSELAVQLREAGAALPTSPDTVISRYYGGVYFSYEQAAALDAIAAIARSTDAHVRDGILAAVLGAASDVVSSVGNQFAQPVRPRSADGIAKPHALAAIARRRRLSVIPRFEDRLRRYAALRPAPYPGDAHQMDFVSALQEMPDDVTAVYADPPYTRDHYSRFYHVLETLAVGDEPEVSTVVLDGLEQPSRGLYRARRHQSPFCIKSRVPGAFSSLFQLTAERRIPLVLSYSPLSEGTKARPNTRLMTIDQLHTLASEYFEDVEVKSAGEIAHSKLNADHLNAAGSSEAEVLILCRP